MRTDSQELHIILKNIMKEKYLAFFDSDGRVNTFKLNCPDLNYFLSNTKFEKDSFLDEDLIKRSYKYAGLDLNYSDRKSDRCYMIKLLKIKNKM